MMNRIILSLAISLAVLQVATASSGVNGALVTPENPHNWSCIANIYQNITDVVIPCWTTAGQDSYCNWNYKMAMNATIQRIDLLVEACPRCNNFNNASQFISNLVNYTSTNNITTQGIWFAVRNPSLWNTSYYSQNLNTLVALVQAAQPYFPVVGIYSNYSSWSQIISTNWNSTLNQTWAWYESFNSSADYYDWSIYGFGSWTRPAMKTYANYTSYCGGYYETYHP